MDTLILVLPHIYISRSYFLSSNFRWIKFGHSSYNFSLTYGNIHLEYLSDHNCLKLTSSMTKVLYGENFNVAKTIDIDKFYLEINFILRIIFSRLGDKFNYLRLTNIEEWIVNRFDLVSNFECTSDYDKKAYLDIFKQLKFPYFKKINYDSGIHDGNKSNCFNFYDKNAEVEFKNNTLDKNILRLEIQIKKNKINWFIKKGYLSGNKLKDLFSNINNLNLIFYDYLNKFGILKEFLSEKEMKTCLLNLLVEDEITKLEHENMKKAVVDKTKCVCKNTLNKYAKILTKYNYSNIVLKKPIKNKLNFSNFELFKYDQSKKFFDQKLQLLIYLYLLNLLFKKIYTRPLQKSSISLTRPLKLITICDDS